MKSIYVHAGSVRTGSTAFQVAALRNHELLRQAGFYYPASEEEIVKYSKRADPDLFTSGNANPIADLFAAGGTDAAADYVKKIVGEPQPSDDFIVLSSENLMWLTEPQLDFLRGTLERSYDARIVLVFCVRDLIDHACSWWAHIVKERLFNVDRLPYVLDHYQNVQYEFLRRATAIFSTEDTLCLRYLSKANLWKSIAQHAGAELPSAIDVGSSPINRSLSLDALTFLQKVAPLLPEGAWRPAANGDNAGSPLFDAIADIVSSADKVSSSSRKPHHFDQETAQKIEMSFNSRFAQDIRWINETFDIQNGPLQITPSDEWKIPSIREASLANTERYAFSLISDFFRSAGEPGQMWSGMEQEIADVALIRNCNMFDLEYYRSEMRRLIPKGLNLRPETSIAHFLTYGVKIGANPSPFFDVAWYVESNPDLGQTNPALHYALNGASEGRSPHPNIAHETAQKLKHAGNLIGLLNLYGMLPPRRVPAIFREILEAFPHHLNRQHAAHADAIARSEIVEADYYRGQISQAGHDMPTLGQMTEAFHFAKYGMDAGINPSPFFDVHWYKNVNPDLAGANAVLHYVTFGAAEGRSPHPLIPSDLAKAFARQKLPKSLVSILNSWHKRTINEQTPQDLAKVLALFD